MPAPMAAPTLNSSSAAAPRQGSATSPTGRVAARARLVRDSYGALPPRMRRELLIYGVALLGGLLAMPLLIWLVGNRVLGPYTHGQNLHAGPWALFGDYVLGLVHGSAVFWAVALGPVVLLLLLRLLVWLIRAIPSRG
jgi:hypothetical protein